MTIPPWSRWPYAIGTAVAVVLVAFAGRYGYHRDELYFLVAGDHLAWGYVDQGPMAPFIARIAPDGLVWLRLASALFSAVTVVLTAALAREFGGGRAAQVLAAAIAAVSAIVLATGHLHTTSTFDLLAWVAICWLVARALRTGDTRLVTAAGAVAGLDLLNKYLVGALGLALVGGLLIAGPRRWLRDPWVLGGAALALVVAAPNLVWQATHDWPQLDMAQSLSTGEDTSYGGRLTFVALQFVLISPYLLPIQVAGAVTLFRRPPFRALAWTWALTTLLFLVVGGKGYYTAGLLLMLAAAGSVVTVEWWSRSRARQVLVGAAVSLSAASAVVMFLPVLPPKDIPDAILAINYDAGETVGWPAFADSVAEVHRSLPPDEQTRAVILTSNYGEAGALARYGPSRGLPRAYSGHNSMADFGTPPEGADVVIAVGFGERRLEELFESVQRAGEIDLGIDNDEDGAPLWVCRQPRSPWSQLWERVRVVG